MKKTIFVVIAFICVLALVGCSATQSQASTTTASAAASSAAPSVSAPASASAAASVSAAAPASSAAAPASSAAASSAGASGLVLTQAYVDAFNKEMAATGQKIVMSLSGNTVTLTVTLDQDIDASQFPSSMQAQYNQILQQQIDAASAKNPDMPNSTWVYIILNKSGQQLLKLTANYTAK